MTKKGKFLQQLNEAFANNDVDFIIENVTDDVRWTIVGDHIIEGKADFTKALEAMVVDVPLNLTINTIITHGKTAAVNGVMSSPEGATYAFCDIYTFSGFKNPKIRTMTSYVIALTQ